MKVSVIIPVVDSAKANICEKAARENAGIPQSDFEVLRARDFDLIGCPSMVKRLTAMASAQLVCFLGEDTIPQKDYLKNALAAMARIGWGVVGLNDQRHYGAATHWLADRRMLPLLDGEFFHTGYKHCFCDNELQERAEISGRYIWARDAVLIHNNDKTAETYPSWPIDCALFQERRKAWRSSKWGKVAVATRIAHRPDPAFFISWTRLIMSGLRPGDGVVTPSVALPHSSAANYVVNEFKKLDCDSLLFIDDDMVFEPDTLDNLRVSGEQYGIYSGLTVIRRWPHKPVVLRQSKDQPRPEPVKDICGIIDVDFTGLAFTLIRKEVIEAVSRKKSDPFEWSNATGEDGSFCIAAREAGFKIGVNSYVSVGHRVESVATFDPYRQTTVIGGQTFLD